MITITLKPMAMDIVAVTNTIQILSIVPTEQPTVNLIQMIIIQLTLATITRMMGTIAPGVNLVVYMTELLITTHQMIIRTPLVTTTHQTIILTPSVTITHQTIIPTPLVIITTTRPQIVTSQTLMITTIHMITILVTLRLKSMTCSQWI